MYKLPKYVILYLKSVFLSSLQILFILILGITFSLFVAQYLNELSFDEYSGILFYELIEVYSIINLLR